MTRPYDCIPVCASAPSDLDISTARTFSPGEQVYVRPIPPGRHESLRAEVLADKGDELRVRAQHSYYLHTGKRVVATGDHFDVHRTAVFSATIPD